jgi:hypothetical protein
MAKGLLRGGKGTKKEECGGMSWGGCEPTNVPYKLMKFSNTTSPCIRTLVSIVASQTPIPSKTT